jgi:hypothetical protein
MKVTFPKDATIDPSAHANGDNPWSCEPDRVEWDCPLTGLRCEIVRIGYLGHLCGYVWLPKGHPWNGVDCLEIERSMRSHPHGGLTYSSPCRDSGGRWKIGFDCAHAGDIIPATSKRFSMAGDTYKDIAFVKTQVDALAASAAEVSI